MKSVALLMILFSALAQAKVDNAECRTTMEFKKMCEICLGNPAIKSERCAGDVPNHGNSSEFTRLMHSIDGMIKACGFRVPAKATIHGLREQLVAVCNDEKPVPDIDLLYANESKKK